MKTGVHTGGQTNAGYDKYAVREVKGRGAQDAAAAVQADLEALEAMLARGMIEDGVRRIGAEQEMFLVDAAQRPAAVAGVLLERLDDPRFTVELARFQLEANLPPAQLGGRCLRDLEATLAELVTRADEAAGEIGASVLLTGIPPTLTPADLDLANLTPSERYAALNRALMGRVGGAFPIAIDGIDRLEMEHDNVVLNGCTASFQLHLQVGPDEFAPLYNLAQAISGPLLAAAAGSPLLLGHRLWHETRVPLFEQSFDPRSESERADGRPLRVVFGDRWVDRSAVELFRETATRYPVLLAPGPCDDPRALVADGVAPPLTALATHNGTVWRWNRACYGVSGGKAHLRIEHRPLGAGPTVLDEVANAALFYGLMTALPCLYGDIARRLDFASAASNFRAAARDGLSARFVWVDGHAWTARALLLDFLLPLAREGLASAGIDPEDIARYLGTLEERVRGRQNAATWMLNSLHALRHRRGRRRALVRAMLARRRSGEPVHRWTVASHVDEERAWFEALTGAADHRSTAA